MLLSTQTEVLGAQLGTAKAIDILAAAGYDAIDLSLFDKGTNGYFLQPPEVLVAEAEKIRTYAAQKGLTVNQTHAPFSFSGEYWADWEHRLVPIMKGAIRFSAALGAKTVIIHPAQYTNYMRYAKELFEVNLRYYGCLRDTAAACGIRIGVENMWQRFVSKDVICPSICADPKELAAMLDALGLDTFTACLDIGHTALTGWLPEEAIRTLGHERLGALHVHDVDLVHDSHTLPGFAGGIQWDNVCRALGEIDYTGDFTFEADNFLHTVIDPEVYPAAAALMAATGRVLMKKVNAARPA